MSEHEELSFMQDLDGWTSATIIDPMHIAVTDGDCEQCDVTCVAIQAAVRSKVLEGYHAGRMAERVGNAKVTKTDLLLECGVCAAAGWMLYAVVVLFHYLLTGT